jgi:hypothetical protein
MRDLSQARAALASALTYLQAAQATLFELDYRKQRRKEKDQ